MRRDQYCIFVPDREPLTNREAAKEIIEEAKHLLQQDLQELGFGFVVRKSESNDEGSSFSVRFQKKNSDFSARLSFSEENSSSDSDSDSEDERDEKFHKNESKIVFPSLIDDENLRVRNVYIDGKGICSEFILMIEHKETMAISCSTRKLRKKNFPPNKNVFQINDQEELKLECVACAFSVHKIFLINIDEDELCQSNLFLFDEVLTNHFVGIFFFDFEDFQQHRMSALIHVREKLLNKKHNVIVHNSLETLFTLLSYLSIPKISGSNSFFARRRRCFS